MMNSIKNKEDENINILINNIKILYNNNNLKSMIIYDYLQSVNIEYDNEYLLNKMKEKNYALYKNYLYVIENIYDNLHNDSKISIFDDYEGSNIWNENTHFYRTIHSMLDKYNVKEKSPNYLNQTRFK